MGKKSRDKGAAFERELAKRLSAALGTEVKRRLGQARDAGHDMDAGDFLVEAKRRRSIATVRWLEQVQRAAAGTQPTRTPLVVMREDHGPMVAMLLLDDLVAGWKGGSREYLCGGSLVRRTPANLSKNWVEVP